MQPPHFIRNCSSFGALTLLLWDTLINYDLEYQHIWKPPAGAVKRIYLIARYFGLCSQIANSAAMLGPLASIHIYPNVCVIWFGCQLVSFLFLLTVLEVVLSLRLYALYQKSRSVGILLIIMTTTGLVVSAVCGVRTLRFLRFDGMCVARRTRYDVVYFSTFAFTRHIFLWMLTMHKRNIGRLGRANRAPVVSLMLRDGALIFCVLSAFLGTVTPYSVLIPAVAQVMVPWTLTFVSMLVRSPRSFWQDTTAKTLPQTCRLILNMQQLQTRTTSSVLELTTNIESENSDPDRLLRIVDVKGSDAVVPSRHRTHSERSS